MRSSHWKYLFILPLSMIALGIAVAVIFLSGDRIAVLGTRISELEKEEEATKLEIHGKHYSHLIARGMALPLHERNFREIDLLLNEALGISGIYGIRIYDTQDKVIRETNRDEDALLWNALGPEEMEVLFKNENTWFGNFLFIFAPITRKDRHLGGVCLSLSPENRGKSSIGLTSRFRSFLITMIRRDREAFLLALSGFFMMTIVLFLLTIRQIWKPVRTLARDLLPPATIDLELSINQNYEIGIIAKYLRDLKNRLQETIHSRDRLTKILDNVGEGLLVCDSSGMIVTVNDTLSDMTGFARKDLLCSGLKTPGTKWKRLCTIEKRLMAGETVKDEEFIISDAEGHSIPVSLSASLMLNRKTNQIDGTVYAFNNNSEHLRLEEKLLHSSLHDALTGLPNRTLLLDRLEQAFLRCKRNPHHKFALLFMDLDRFKNINDSLGHSAGDKVLRTIAERLMEKKRPADTVSRLGGDEFVILLGDLNREEDAERVARRILAAISRPMLLKDQQIYLSGSIGIAHNDGSSRNGDEMLANADLAMYRAKADGKGRITTFSKSMTGEKGESLLMEFQLKEALERNEIEILYRPVVDIFSDRIAGFEALARWNHPKRGQISPEEFIPLAEETGLIVPLGNLALTTAIKQLKRWRTLVPSMDLAMSVNVSGRQIMEENFYDEVVERLHEGKIPPSSLILEITESLIMGDTPLIRQTLENLKELGIRLSIDDFGTGYSNLMYLSRFSFDMLKIDRSFINGISEGDDRLKIVETIAALGHGLNISLVVEGVESRRDFQQVTPLHCQYYQGFLFSPPLPAKAAEKLLLERSERTDAITDDVHITC